MMQMHAHFRRKIITRLDELGLRLNAIDNELDQPKPKDLADQAIDLEDDEVLETLGLAAQLEVHELKRALQRLADGSFGTCAECQGPISNTRLEAVPQARLCRICAQEAALS